MNAILHPILRPLSFLVLALLLTMGASGAVAAERKLSFAVSGVIAALKVRSGDSVKAGAVLAVLDLTTFNARKRSADAKATSAKLILDLAEVKLNQIRELFDALSASQEEVEAAEISFANAQSSYQGAKAKAEVTAWRLQRATLRAPFSGTVSAVPGYPGMIINPYAVILPVVVVNAP